MANEHEIALETEVVTLQRENERLVAEIVCLTADLQKTLMRIAELDAVQEKPPGLVTPK